METVYMYNTQVQRPVLENGADLICAKVLGYPLPHTTSVCHAAH